MPLAKVGIMGSFINPDTSLFRHRLSIYMLVISLLSATGTAVRVWVPYFRKNYPLRVAMTTSHVLQIFGIIALQAAMYLGVMSNDYPRFTETKLVEYRLSTMIGVHVLMTAFYFLAQKFILTMLPQDQRPAQAANIIRVGVKLSLFCYWALSGDFYTVVTTHPLELTSAKYETTELTMFMINALYQWEMMFRDLMPVNVIHHAIACAGLTSFKEWASVLEPARTNTSMPILGSLIEGFCCMGGMCYRFLSKGRLLNRILVAITGFVLISYNLLLVGYVVTLYAYQDLYSWGYGKVCMPALAAFTYPAQMNMARIFWTLSKKALPPKTPKQDPLPVPAEPEAISAETLRKRV